MNHMNRRVGLRLLLTATALAVVAAPAHASDPVQQDVAGAAPVQERPPLIATQAFAARGMLLDPQMSPDGRRIVSRMVRANKEIVVVIDSATRAATNTFGLPDKTELAWVRWAGPDKLLISVAQPSAQLAEGVRYTRVILLDLVSGAHVPIARKEPVVIGDDVIFVDPAGEYALISMQRTIYEYPAVWRFELREKGAAAIVEKPREGVWDWFADESGQVRIGQGWSSGRFSIYYRSAAGGELKRVERLKEADLEQRDWWVARLEPGSDVAHVYYETPAGRLGLGRMDFAQRGAIEPIYASPDHDVDDVLFTSDGRLRAVAFTDDRSRVHWTGEDDRRLQAQLQTALRQSDVFISSRARDNSRMLVWAGNEADPGAFYVYSPAERKLDQLSEQRPTVDFRQLAPGKAVTYTARDGTPIRAYLTLPRGRAATGLPLIIMPHGGPYGVRDSLRYDDWVQLLANRGYAVLQPNYRGSGGHGVAFEKLGDGQIGRGMQDDLDDAMDWAVAEGIADQARVCMVGGSYGGYAALWAVIRNPERYRCAASWAGVTDWDSMLRYDRKFFSPRGNRKWRQRIEGEGGFDLDAVSPYRLAHTLQRPVLLGQGTADTIVPPFQYHRFRKAAAAAKVKPVELLLEDEGHSFINPKNEQAWYDALTTFLARHNPAD
ncbi:S9 family peptidase [Porphyrobacter sp. GA68]|uniref:alpha/beta hydrolase family protein n=1 Tax=Porphyrobacter sp. GA68 TaxID=2883480 RepID=UPI001D17E26C|nr:alpha/beta fold hydrolase [Porphyrobacter sp. GA68]